MTTDIRDDGRLAFGLAGRIVLFSGVMLAAYAQAALTPILPTIVQHYSYYPNAALLVRLMLSIVGFGLAIASPIVGAIADRFGARRVLLAGLVVYSVAGCAPFFLENLYLILATRLVLGVAAAAVSAVILVLLIRNSVGTTRSRWLGYVSMGTTLAGLCYSPLVGYIGHFDWRWPFLTYGVAMIIFALAVIGIEPDPARRTDATGQRSGGPNTRPAGGFQLGTPLGYIGFVFLAGAVISGPTLYIPFRIHETGISDTRIIGTMMMPLAIFGSALSFCYGWLRKFLSVDATFAVGFAGIAVGLTTLATAQDTVQLLIGLIIMGSGMGVSIPNVYQLASMAGADAYRARTVGFSKSGFYGGAMLSQLIIDTVSRSGSAQFALLGMGLVATLLAVHSLWRLVSPRLAPA